MRSSPSGEWLASAGAAVAAGRDGSAAPAPGRTGPAAPGVAPRSLSTAPARGRWPTAPAPQPPPAVASAVHPSRPDGRAHSDRRVGRRKVGPRRRRSRASFGAAAYADGPGPRPRRRRCSPRAGAPTRRAPGRSQRSHRRPPGGGGAAGSRRASRRRPRRRAKERSTWIHECSRRALGAQSEPSGSAGSPREPRQAAGPPANRRPGRMANVASQGTATSGDRVTIGAKPLR